MSDLYRLGEEGLKNTAVQVGDGWGIRKWVDEAIASKLLTEAEPTDRICLYHNVRTAVDRNRCVLSYNDLDNETPACEMVDVVRVGDET